MIRVVEKALNILELLSSDTSKAFSLSEIQAVFEAVADRALDSSNFRRFIRTRYLDTGLIRLANKADRRGRGRPAALYTWIGQ